MTNEQIEKKLKFIIRWVFSDIAVNVRSDNKIWQEKNLDKETVYKYGFEVGESNIGSIQLICVGIETFGRIAKGKKDEKDVSKDCFVGFIKSYFSDEYKNIAEELYKRYRCGLLHSHILGFKNAFYPNRYNRDKKACHLFFGNESNSEFQAICDKQHQRMVLDIDKFYSDFKSAVSNFCEELFLSNQLVINVSKSLEDTLED